MIELTTEARQRFDDYLARMRSALRGTRAVEADEVEQSVREHVELALAGAPAPVGAGQLAAVLDQLGAPERWLPDEERPMWRRMLSRISEGPEDWRLAYLTFAITAAGFLLFPAGGILLFAPAFLLARANVELLKERGEPLGARRWLVLPVIWMAFLLVVGPALIVPVVGGAAAMIAEGGTRYFGFEPPNGETLESVRLGFGIIASIAGIWWVILSGIFAIVMKPFRALFHPITQNVSGRHALILAIVGVVIGGLGLAILATST